MYDPNPCLQLAHLENSAFEFRCLGCSVGFWYNLGSVWKHLM